jgi:hypothetical protein
MSKRKAVTKFVVGGMASLGAGMIVGTVVKLHMPQVLPLWKHILISTGSLALSGAAADVAKNYTHQTIDEIAEAMRIIKLGEKPFIVIQENDPKEEDKNV